MDYARALESFHGIAIGAGGVGAEPVARLGRTALTSAIHSTGARDRRALNVTERTSEDRAPVRRAAFASSSPIARSS